MYLGRLVELARAETLFARAAASVHADAAGRRSRELDMHRAVGAAPVAGEVPNPIDPPPGCTFHPRCPFANERCRVERPVLLDDRGRRWWRATRSRKGGCRRWQMAAPAEAQ